MNPPIPEAFKALLAHYGKQHWWPAESQEEMMLGAILTQNTAWTNVEQTLSNLRKHPKFHPTYFSRPAFHCEDV